MVWSKSLVEWTEDDAAYLSVVFSWDLPQAYQRAVWLRASGYRVLAGGPAVKLNPGYLAEVAECDGTYVDAIAWHNPNATFTSRGCIRRCSFCAVPKLEGDLRELDNWPVRPIVCDNNLLACSRRHFDAVIDLLKPLHGIDFNQGLDARILTEYQAGRLAELDCTVRLAFDSVGYEPQFMRAFERLRAAGFPLDRIRVYVLIGYKDTPDDALYRLQRVAGLGLKPNPMRYQALDAMRRNSYVGPGWTNSELRRYMRYWANLRFLQAVPFAEFSG